MKNLNRYDAYNKDHDNVETVKGLNAALKSWLETLSMPFDGYNKSIENFEFRSRDGFAAHSHNRGGLDLFIQTNVSYLMGSGEHFGLEIESWTEKSWDNARAELLTRDEYKNMDTDSDEFFDAVYEYCNDEYEGIAWRVRVMYEGQGVLRIYAGYDKDAPYYRWSGAELFEAEVNFKNIPELKRKLRALTKKVEDSQNESQKKA